MGLKIAALVLLAACSEEPVDFTPEGEQLGTFTGNLAAPCTCVGNGPFDVVCRATINGTSAPLRIAVNFDAIPANVRDTPQVALWFGDYRGEVTSVTAWFGGDLVPDPREGHLGNYRALGIDEMTATDQPLCMERPSLGSLCDISYAGFRLVDGRFWCEAQ